MNFKLKTAGIMAVASGIVMLTSAMSVDNVPLEVGNQAPELSLISADGRSEQIAQLKGENVIVNFWSVSDAESRVSNIRLAKDAERNGVRFISMCIDSDKSLAEEVMKADNLPAESRFFANEQTVDNYQLDKGVRTVKIDPYGIVAAID